MNWKSVRLLLPLVLMLGAASLLARWERPERPSPVIPTVTETLRLDGADRKYRQCRQFGKLTFDGISLGMTAAEVKSAGKKPERYSFNNGNHGVEVLGGNTLYEEGAPLIRVGDPMSK